MYDKARSCGQRKQFLARIPTVTQQWPLCPAVGLTLAQSPSALLSSPAAVQSITPHFHLQLFGVWCWKESELKLKADTRRRHSRFLGVFSGEETEVVCERSTTPSLLLQPTHSQTLSGVFSPFSALTSHLFVHSTQSCTKPIHFIDALYYIHT